MNTPPKSAPQTQAAYERVVLAGAKVIYDPSTHAGIMKMLQSGQPADALAHTTTMIITQLDHKSGGQIPGPLILPAAAELIGELAKLASTAGLFKVDTATLAVAMQKLVVALAGVYGVNKQSLQKLIASVPHDKLSGMVQQQSQYAQQASSKPTSPGTPPSLSGA